MPNIAVILKNEILRLARKEVKTQAGKTKQAVAQYRHEIAKLKRLLADQAKRLARLEAQGNGEGGGEVEDTEEKLRFSARSVKAQRRRLKLSAAEYGKLIGVSGLTIYNWESGKARPRKAQFDAFVAVRGIGKKEALAKLEAMEVKKPQRRKAK
jgi:DNA-binding transcriptional regulator YiaG